MAKTRLHGLLEVKIAETRQIVLESIADGACSDYAAYRDQCGFLRGLDTALAILDDIHKEHE